jgi:hypothetical protein
MATLVVHCFFGLILLGVALGQQPIANVSQLIEAQGTVKHYPIHITSIFFILKTKNLIIGCILSDY